jgi:hypothetical protein
MKQRIRSRPIIGRHKKVTKILVFVPLKHRCFQRVSMKLSNHPIDLLVHHIMKLQNLSHKGTETSVKELKIQFSQANSTVALIGRF